MSKENKTLRYSTEIKIVQSSIKKLNPQFSLCDILVCYHGDNRNWTSLSKDCIENALYSIYGIPIVGEWIYKLDGTDEKSWGSHGGRIICDSEGVRFEQTTKPYGFVTKEAAENASWVTITEKDGHTQREYLKLSGCILWTDRYEVAQSILDKNYGQSMEIEMTKGKYRDDGYYDVKEFIFSALCILGTDVEPCFESACIGRHYELDTFKQEFTKMLDEYKQFQTNENQSKGGKEMAFGKYVEALSSVTFTNSADETVCKYRLLDVNENQLYVLDMEDYVPYSLDYAVTEEGDVETVAIDFNSKTEMSLSATEKITDEDFEEFNIISEINSASDAKTNSQMKLLEEEFNQKLGEIQTSYNELAESFSVASKKLEEYEAKEAAAQAKQHEAEVEAVFEKYAERLGKCAEFLVYKAKVNPADVTVDEVTEKLTLMAGKFMMNTASKKNFSYNPVEAGATRQRDTSDTTRYGHLLDKYIK